jgi:hypothetical protein
VRQEARAAAVLRPELEVGLGRRRLLQQAAGSLELRRLRAMRRAGDRELHLGDVVALAGKGQRLERFRGRAVQRDEARIAGRLCDPAVLDDDRVDTVRSLHQRPAPHGYADRAHGEESLDA